MERRGMKEPVSKKYFREIAEFPLLSKEEEKELGKMLRSKGEKAAEAKKRLICCNLRLVVMVARRCRGQGLGLLDLIQAGNLGLIEAVKRFDGRKRNRFATYAFWWIRVEIQKALTQGGQITIPFYLTDRTRKITRVEKYLRAKNGFASNSEISEITGFSEEEICKIQRVERIKKSVSLNQKVKIDNEEGKELIDFLTDEKEQNQELDLIERIDLRKELNRVLSEFPARTAKIICRKGGYDPNNRDGRRPETYRQIGGKLDLTGSRIEQIYNGALREMRKLKKFQSLREIYLSR